MCLTRPNLPFDLDEAKLYEWFHMWYHSMSQRDKLLLKMRRNKLNWRIEDIKTLAEYYDIRYRQPGTSHVIFSMGSYRVCIPAHKPIKPIYINQFLEMLETP